MHPNTLEQFRVFREIVIAGSFSQASKNLSKTLSAVSYTISTLENQLGITLFDRSGHRPVLSEAGQVLY